MKTVLAACSLAMMAATSSLAQSTQPAPAELEAGVFGERTQIAVFGTMHLGSQLAEFEPEWIDPILEELEEYAPTHIMIERMSGEQIAHILEREDEFPGILPFFTRNYFEPGQWAQTALGLSRQEAAREFRNAVETGDSADTAAARRRLSLLALAAFEPDTAALHWLHLENAERIGDELVTEQLADWLNAYASSNGETISLAARLAARLGHQRLYPFDDNMDKNDYVLIADQVGADIQNSQVWTDVMASPEAAEIMGLAASISNADELDATLRYLNTEAYQIADAQLQWTNMVRADMPSGSGRARNALWEVRNLRMAANIRQWAARDPGARVLVIVGASHKIYLDAYLDEMMGVEIVDMPGILAND